MIRALRRHKDPTAAPPYLSLFKLREAPFSSNGGGKFFYPDPERAQTLNMLQHLTQYSEELLLVAGPAGSGKSSLLEQYLARADDDWKVCRISGAEISDPGVLFLTAARCFGLHTEGLTSENLLDALREHLNQLQQSMIPVLVVDAAERLTDDALEVIVRLAELPGDHGKLVRTILFAEPSILQRLSGARFATVSQPHMLQLKPLDEGQLTSYLHHRLSAAGYGGGPLFSARELKRIYKGAHGWPGGINRMAHEVLMDKLQAARPSRWRMMVIGGIVIGLAVGAYAALFTDLAGHAPAGSDTATSTAARVAPEQPIVRYASTGANVQKALVVRGGETLQITCAAPIQAAAEPVVNRSPAPLQPVAAAKPEEHAAPVAEAKPEEHAEPMAAAKAEEHAAPVAEAKPEEHAAPMAAAKAEEHAAPVAAAKEEEHAAPVAEAKPEEHAAPVAEAKPEEHAAPEAAAKVEEHAAPATVATAEEQPSTMPATLAALPQVSGVEPSPVPGSLERQRVIVRGSNFVPQSRVAVSWRGRSKTLAGDQVKVLDAQHIAVELTTGTKAETWSVAVSAADGRFSPPYRFQVSAPAKASTPAKAAAPAAAVPAGYRNSAWLKAQAPGHFTVQLVAATTEQAIRDHFAGYNVRGDIAMLVTRRDDKPWYVVFWGNFADRAAAERAVAGLPAPLRRVSPWIRSFADVHGEMKAGGVEAP